MKLVNAECPNCGAKLSVDPSKGRYVCEYCGSEILIDDESRHIPYDNAEEAGYRFEKGRQRAQAESQADYTSYYPSQQSAPKKRRTWLWVLGWIFIFPVPLTILMVRSKKLNIWIRIAIIAAAWIIFFAIGLSNKDENPEETAQPVSETQAATQSPSALSDETDIAVVD